METATYSDTRNGTTTRSDVKATGQASAFYVTPGSAPSLTRVQKFVPVGLLKDAKKYNTIDLAGKVNNAKRWILAYETTLALHGMTLGAVYVPCYLCGSHFDAWTMDVEHVVPGVRRSTAPGRVLLACSNCNSKIKGEVYGYVPENVRERVARIGGRITVRMTSGTPTCNAYALYSARIRRDSTVSQESVPA